MALAAGEVGWWADALGACVDGQRALAALGAEGVAGVPVQESAGLAVYGGWGYVSEMLTWERMGVFEPSGAASPICRGE